MAEVLDAYQDRYHLAHEEKERELYFRYFTITAKLPAPLSTPTFAAHGNTGRFAYIQLELKGAEAYFQTRARKKCIP